MLIGHLQTNKAKDAARDATEVQSLDRLDLAEALHRRLAQEGRTLDALVQVKTSSEPSKYGMAPEDVPAFLRRIASDFPTLRVRGLMTLAVNSPDPAEVRACLRALRELRDRLRLDLPAGVSLDRLSMGMSGDFELAIEEGSTEVRIGTAVFGARSYPSRNSRTSSRAPGRPDAAPQRLKTATMRRNARIIAAQNSAAAPSGARPRIHIDPARGDTPCTSTRSACWRWPPCPWPPLLPAPNPGPPSRSAGSCPTGRRRRRRGRAHGRRRHGKPLGQTIVVENRPGATIIGATAVSQAEPSGYMIGTADSGTLAFNPRCTLLSYDPSSSTSAASPSPAAAGGECELAVQVGGRRDRGRQERARQADRRPPAPARPTIWRWSCSSSAPAPSCCTCPTRAPRLPSRTCWADRWT